MVALPASASGTVICATRMSGAPFRPLPRAGAFGGLSQNTAALVVSMPWVSDQPAKSTPMLDSSDCESPSVMPTVSHESNCA